MLHFTKCITFLLFGSRVTLILFLDAYFALYCIQRQIGFAGILVVDKFFTMLLKERLPLRLSTKSLAVDCFFPDNSVYWIMV